MRYTKRMVAAAALLTGWSVASRAQDAPKKTADQVFKNIQVLKGIPVDDFMGTMGIMSAAVGVDCSECHNNAGTVNVDWAADTQKKIVARRMVQMVEKINRENFSGRQMVTCWSCHHGRDRPATSPSMDVVYGPASQEMDDILTQAPGQPPASQILDKYIQAVGGAEKLAAVKSYAANGTSVTFGGLGGGGRVEIQAKFPDKRVIRIDFPNNKERGDEVRAYNGREAWLRTPLTVLGEYELTGGELDGARLDALLGFPGQIKEALTNWRVSLPTTISDLPGPSSQTGNDNSAAIGQDRPVNVLQGTGPRNIICTLYFDQQTGLLVRMVRYGKSPIGRVPTQVDFADYRDAGNGVKMPYRMIFAWLDGRDSIQLNQIKINAPVDDAKFGKPAPNTAK